MILKHSSYNMSTREIKFDLWKIIQSYTVNNETSVSSSSMMAANSNNTKMINSNSSSVNNRPTTVAIQ